MRCAGILLTGGASTRMGRDKATIVWDGTTLAARAAGAVQAVTDPAIEVGPGVSGLPHVADDREGPFAALACGLETLPGSMPVLLLACDLPLINEAVLRAIRDHPHAGSVVPLWRGRPQPLCARWSAAALATVETLRQRGQRSFRQLLEFPDVVHTEAAGLDDVDTEADLASVTRHGARPDVEGDDPSPST